MHGHAVGAAQVRCSVDSRFERTMYRYTKIGSEGGTRDRESGALNKCTPRGDAREDCCEKNQASRLVGAERILISSQASRRVGAHGF